MFRPSGILIIVGVVTLVMGIMPPSSILCVAIGALCTGFGVYGLDKESKELKDGPEDEHLN